MTRLLHRLLHRSFAGRRLARRCAVIAGLSVLLGSCASRAGMPGWTPIDCTAAQMRCHEGRFGLTYRVERSDGTQADAVNGTWRWEGTASPPPPAILPDRQAVSPDEPVRDAWLQPRAQLELSNVLGVRIATVQQSGRLLLLTDGQGRRHYARDWDDLFYSLFELRLPGQAIAAWMAGGANPQIPPYVDRSDWQTETGSRRLRMTWRTDAGQIRLDLIPDSPSP